MHKFRYDTQSRLRFVRSPKLNQQLTYYTESQFNKEKSFNADIQFNLQNTVGDFGKQDFNVNTIKITFAVFSTSELANSKLLWSAGDDSNGQSISIDKDNIIFTNKRNGRSNNYTIPHQLQLVPRSWNWYYTFIIHHHPDYGLQLHVKTPENTWAKQTQQMNLSFDDVKGFPYRTVVSQHIANLAWYQAKGNISQQVFDGMVDSVKNSDIPQPETRGIELPVCSGGMSTRYNPQTPDHYAHFFNLSGKGNLSRKDQFPQQGQPSEVCIAYTTRSGYPQCRDPFWMTRNDDGVSDGTDRIRALRELRTYTYKTNGEANTNHKENKENCILLQATVEKGIAFQYGASGGNAKEGNPTVYFKNDNVLVRFKEFVIECPCAGLRQPKAFATVILYANAQGVNLYCKSNSSDWNSLFVPKDDFPSSSPFDSIFKSTHDIILTSDETRFIWYKRSSLDLKKVVCITEIFKDRSFDALKPVPIPAPEPTLRRRECRNEVNDFQILWRQTGEKFQDLHSPISDSSFKRNFPEIEMIVFYYKDERDYAKMTSLLIQLFGNIELPVFKTAVTAQLRYFKSPEFQIGPNSFKLPEFKPESPEVQKLVDSSEAYIIQYAKFKLDWTSSKQELVRDLRIVQQAYNALCT